MKKTSLLKSLPRGKFVAAGKVRLSEVKDEISHNDDKEEDDEMVWSEDDEIQVWVEDNLVQTLPHFGISPLS